MTPPSHHLLPHLTLHNICNMANNGEKPWHAAFPAPTLTAPIMPRRRAAQMLSLKGVASLLMIDVRRTDFEGLAVPLQSLENPTEPIQVV